MNAERNMQQAPPSSSISSSFSSRATKKILIVDDDFDITSTFKMGLESKGFKVDTFNDPEEALSNFKAGIYDLLLLDVRMPRINGFQLYEELKKIDDKTKICFITAFEVYYRSLREEFPELKVDCFIKKPVEIEQLAERIQSELG
jgi:two-component system, OmpR family, response regulator ChvI